MTAPAQFRRITPETEITAPCVLANDATDPVIAVLVWHQEIADRYRPKYTHWLPVQWPEVRA